MITLSLLSELIGCISNKYCLPSSSYRNANAYEVKLSSIHSMMLDLDKKELSAKYQGFLSIYKIVTLVFMVVPYIDLKIWVSKCLTRSSNFLLTVTGRSQTCDFYGGITWLCKS